MLPALLCFPFRSSELDPRQQRGVRYSRPHAPAGALPSRQQAALAMAGGARAPTAPRRELPPTWREESGGAAGLPASCPPPSRPAGSKTGCPTPACAKLPRLGTRTHTHPQERRPWGDEAGSLLCLNTWLVFLTNIPNRHYGLITGSTKTHQQNLQGQGHEGRQGDADRA